MGDISVEAVGTSERRALSFSLILYVSCGLVIVNYLCSLFLAVFLFHQLRAHPNGWPMRVLVFSAVLIAAAFFVEMFAIDCLYFRTRAPLKRTSTTEFRDGTLITHFLYGVGVGLLASLVAVPTLLLFRLQLNPANIILQCPSCLASMSLFFLYLIGLPITTELFFRGCLLKLLEEHATIGAAILVSALFFAAIWPLFNPLAGFAVGIASGIIYHRTGSILACTVSNAVVSMCCGAFLLLHGLRII